LFAFSGKGQGLKQFVDRYFHLVFIGLFFALSVFLLFAPPIWDEDVYLRLADHTLSNPSDMFPPMLSWVPQPPLMWYLVAVFSPAPRLAPLVTSVFCVCFLFYACRRLYGGDVAKLASAALVSTGSYLLFSLVVFPDGPVMNFMAVSALSFLCWVKLREQKFLLLLGFGLTLAAMSDYTAVPILSVTFLVWLVIIRKSFNWSRFFKLLGVVSAALLPLLIWINSLSQIYGNIAYHYSSVNNLFSDSMLLRLALNLIYFGSYVVLLGGLPLISWIRKPSFDLDSKLLLIYSATVFTFFLFITPLYAYANPPYNRYLLPIIPALTVISARSLAKEKLHARFLILLPQFICASAISALILLSLL